MPSRSFYDMDSMKHFLLSKSAEELEECYTLADFNSYEDEAESSHDEAGDGHAHACFMILLAGYDTGDTECYSQK